jgi:ankyrin repeat protein
MVVRSILFALTVWAAVTSSAVAGEIHSAAAEGRTDRVKALLEKDASQVNAPDETGRTPLHWACRGEFPELIAFLVESGADVDALDNNGIAPLHSAAARGYADVATYLLDHGASVDPVSYDRKTPLHYAGIYGHAAVAAVLLERGADIEARNSRERTPLLLTARESGDAETAGVLIDNGADINAVDKYDDTPLTLSAWRGYAGVVNLLIEKGVRFPEDEATTGVLMQYSVSKGLPVLFEELTKRGADLNARNRSGGSLTHSAAVGGDPDILRRLIDGGLSVNEPDTYGWYPIHYGAEKGHVDALGVLLESGADIDARNLCGETAWNIAEKEDKNEAAALLAGKGANTAAPAFPELTGPYMGQKPPGEDPELFARGIVSSKWSVHTPVVFSADGKEAYWPQSVPIPGSGYARGVVFFSRVEDGRWTAPARAPFNTEEDNDGDPSFSPDGKRLFFLSSRPIEAGGQSGGENIWYMDRTAGGWSEPKSVGEAVNSVDLHWQISVAANGNLYFGSSQGGGLGQNDVYVSRFVKGEYTTPENLGPAVNTAVAEFSPFVAPDESYLIFTRSGERGNLDLHISFRAEDGSWTEGAAMPAPVNTESGELCGLVSPDGEYLFFLSHRNDEQGVYWMKADVIEKLRKQTL